MQNTSLINNLKLEIDLLRGEYNDLSDRYAKLIAIMEDSIIIPKEWNLPRREEQVLIMLYNASRPVTCSDWILMVDPYQQENLEPVVMESHVSKLRKKLRNQNIPVTIVSRRFEGYWITDESKDYLKKLKEAHYARLQTYNTANDTRR